MQDIAPVAVGTLGILLSVLFLWRGYAGLDDAPACAELSRVSGAAAHLRLERRFYSAQWLEFTIEDQALYVPASPYVRKSAAALRSGRPFEAAFCARRGEHRSRVWELSGAGRTIFDPTSWRAEGSDRWRVAVAASLLSLCLAGFGFGLARRAA